MKSKVSAAAQVDWASVLAKLTPLGKKNILDLRSRHEELRKLINEARIATPKLDFSDYKKKLPGVEWQKLLKESEEQVNNFKNKPIDVSNKLKELEENRRKAVEVMTT
mgnify:CR=1 FL=1